MSASIARRALLVLLPAVFVACGSQAQEKLGSLGFCSDDSLRLDSYMQALCDGETALQANRAGDAVARFRFAAALPRVEATNELAWAGLAAALCSAGEFESGAQWAAHFVQARRLWLGELDCNAAEGDLRARLSPYVRSRMCSDRLVADYELLRNSPTAPYAIDLQARLQRTADAVAQFCLPAASTSEAGATPPVKKAAKSTKAKKKRGKRTAAGSSAGRAKTN